MLTEGLKDLSCGKVWAEAHARTEVPGEADLDRDRRRG